MAVSEAVPVTLIGARLVQGRPPPLPPSRAGTSDVVLGVRLSVIAGATGRLAWSGDLNQADSEEISCQLV